MDLSWHQIDRQSDYRLLDYLGPFFIMFRGHDEWLY